MSAFCLEVNLVLYVPRDRDSEADVEIDAESDAESDAEADVKANVNADLEADAEAGLGSIGVVELVWPGFGSASVRRCFCCLNRVGYSFSALFDSSMVSTDEVYEVVSQLAWWLLRKINLKVY